MRNRNERRRERKLSRDATNQEIMPDLPAGPIQPAIKDAMLATLKALQQAFPGYDITLFLAEKTPADADTLPRFNYGSTADRADMYAVLRAFLAKNKALDNNLDRIDEPPPTETRQ